MADINDKTNFRINRTSELKKLYSGEEAALRRYDQKSKASQVFANAAAVREALKKAINERDPIVQASRQLFATNPVYASIINYLSNIFMWRYKVTPHKVYTKSKVKLNKNISEEDYRLMYYGMLEVVDGLSIETKFPSMLTYLFTQGSVYFTTLCDEDSLTIDTLILPDKYCRKIGETQYGTAIIEFDFSYFDDKGLLEHQLKDYFKAFPEEFKKGYNKYKKDVAFSRWQALDPRFSSGILLNEYSIPTFFYVLGGILDYETYQDNELERNSNMLKYLVVQKMPIYQDKLVFEVDEVNALHKSMRKVIDRGEKTKLITTFGDVELLKIAENDTAENQVLSKSYKAIFQNGGFNSSLFTSDNAQALKTALIKDKGIVWRYVQALLNFYSIAINNWFDFKGYQADIDILPISTYTYNDDIKVYKENATLGVGKLDYIIATGIKQKNIENNLYLESFLHLDQLRPMQTSYTQTAEDRVKTAGDDNGEGKTSSSTKSDIEPSDKEEKDLTPSNTTDED